MMKTSQTGRGPLWLRRALRVVAAVALSAVLLPGLAPGQTPRAGAAPDLPPPCNPGQLRAGQSWQGATGALAGAFSYANFSDKACTLAARPLIQMVDANRQPLPVLQVPGTGSDGVLIEGTVVLQPGQGATSFAVWRNFCGPAPAMPVEPLVTVPGFPNQPLNLPIGAPPQGTPRCDVPTSPSTIAVGPFQPASGQGISFSGLTPAPGSTVNAGAQTIAGNIASPNGVGRVGLLLNTQVLTFELGGPSANQVSAFTSRILAPGRYTATLTAEDSAGNRGTASWQFTVQGTTVPADLSQVDAKIEIVFPHNFAPVTQANLANIGVQLFTPGTLIPVPCNFNQTVRLWRALNANPAEQVGVGAKISRTVGGVTFQEWDFNNIDVSAARNPNNKLFFFVTVDNVGTNSNVWVHGADPRTIFPIQDTPTGVVGWPPQVDAKVEIVFPFNGAPVSQARLANIGTDIFVHGTLNSVDNSLNPYVFLLRSLNANVGTFGATGDRISWTTGGVTHPRWVFNEVDVSEATAQVTPPNLILFRNVVNGVTTFTDVWSHGADVRTFFPIQDVPSQSCQ